MNFEKEWQLKQEQKDLDQARKFWDFRAEEFNEIGKNHSENDALIKMLIDKGAIFEGAKVLDIGCGAGRYSKLFLKMGCRVTGIDISPNMIDFSKVNAVAFDQNYFNFKVLTWEEADLQKEGWENAFDLVFASMSPAINGPQALRKMIAASRNFCFMSSHLYKKDQIGENLKKQLNLKNKKGNYRQNLYYAFNMLWEMGYFPEFTHQDYSRQKTWNVDKAFNYYKQILDGQEEEVRLKELLQNKSVNGVIKDENESKSGWLFWSVLDQKEL